MSFSARIERRQTPRMMAYEKMSRKLVEHRIKIHAEANFFYPDCAACSRMEKEIFKMQKERQERSPFVSVGK